MVHFIHRGLAYLLFILVCIWWFKARTIKGNVLFGRLCFALPALVITQVVLGILTVLNATYSSRLVILGVLHQCTAMLLLMCVTALLYVLRKKI